MDSQVKKKLGETTGPFSFIRFSEWRPQTFSADVTLEIPTLAQFLTEEYFTPISFHFWVEITSLTIKSIQKMSKKIESLIEASMTVGKEVFRDFPPVEGSFEVSIHALQFNSQEQIIIDNIITFTNKQLANQINRGFSWDLEKWIRSIYTKSINSNYDCARWDIVKGIHFIQKYINELSINLFDIHHSLLFSGWHTEQFELENINSFESNSLTAKVYLFNLAPTFAKTLEFSKFLNIENFYLFTEQSFELIDFWKKKIQKIIEPVLELKIDINEKTGEEYKISTNSMLFQELKKNSDSIIYYNLLSIRYPLRINFLFSLPTSSLENQDSSSPIVWNKVIFTLKTSNGKILKQEVIENCKAYKLAQVDQQFQPERELNSRMRMADQLRARLETLLKQQTERMSSIKQLITEPQLLSEHLDENLLAESLNDLSLAFEILDYLSEEELLLSELPPTTKMFQPPENDFLM